MAGSLRDQITGAVCRALEPFSDVVAGWEGGSAAFGLIDNYSDIDLFFLVNDNASHEPLYAAVEDALRGVSPVVASHYVAPGRYYQLEAAGEYLLVDLCLLRVSDPDHHLDIERHGHVRPLFDKGDWLRARSGARVEVESKRVHWCRELEAWFVLSQGFARKAIWRGRQAEALAVYWAATLKPLADLLRIRYCPARWDFGMRYMDRDLPPAVYCRFCELMFVQDLKDLELKLETAGAWGTALLKELGPAVGGDSDTPV
jgi:hypothetical protein